MSTSAISVTSAYVPQSAPSTFQKVKSDFSQVGKDLQSGNLSQAQADFATLSKDLPSGQQNSNSPVAKAVTDLGQALQSGNLSQAQQAYSTIQQSVQQAGGHHHHHHHQESPQGSSAQNSAVSQDFGTLGQDLQSGDLTGAQKAFTSLQKDLQQYTSTYQAAAATQPAQTTGSGVSVSA